MLDKNRSSFVCFDCRSNVYYSARAVPYMLLCNECLWIRTLMPNPTERAEMRADETLIRALSAVREREERRPETRTRLPN
jgi:hypothetical protein